MGLWKVFLCNIIHIMSILCNLRLNNPFISVQTFYGRTTKHPMVVRPDTLTPYVLTPFERTTKHPMDVRPWKISMENTVFYAQQTLFQGV